MNTIEAIETEVGIWSHPIAFLERIFKCPFTHLRDFTEVHDRRRDIGGFCQKFFNLLNRAVSLTQGMTKCAGRGTRHGLEKTSGKFGNKLFQKTLGERVTLVS